jgi:CheY-like chemotaxis protein
VRQSGGQVQLYSEAGQGTSVRLFLPAAQSSHAEVEEAESPSSEGAPIRGGSEMILVVEDDARVRRVVVARLKDFGYRIIEAATGTEALTLLAGNPEISLLFTDVVMEGGISGDELAKEVRVKRPDIKILFTSGYAEPSIAGRELAEAGNWLKKPYTARELGGRLRELFDQS